MWYTDIYRHTDIYRNPIITVRNSSLDFIRDSQALVFYSLFYGTSWLQIISNHSRRACISYGTDISVYFCSPSQIWKLYLLLKSELWPLLTLTFAQVPMHTFTHVHAGTWPQHKLCLPHSHTDCILKPSNNKLQSSEGTTATLNLAASVSQHNSPLSSHIHIHSNGSSGSGAPKWNQVPLDSF